MNLRCRQSQTAKNKITSRAKYTDERKILDIQVDGRMYLILQTKEEKYNQYTVPFCRCYFILQDVCLYESPILVLYVYSEGIIKETLVIIEMFIQTIASSTIYQLIHIRIDC